MTSLAVFLLGLLFTRQPAPRVETQAKLYARFAGDEHSQAAQPQDAAHRLRAALLNDELAAAALRRAAAHEVAQASPKSPTASTPSKALADWKPDALRAAVRVAPADEAAKGGGARQYIVSCVGADESSTLRVLNGLLDEFVARSGLEPTGGTQPPGATPAASDFPPAAASAAPRDQATPRSQATPREPPELREFERSAEALKLALFDARREHAALAERCRALAAGANLAATQPAPDKQAPVDQQAPDNINPEWFEAQTQFAALREQRAELLTKLLPEHPRLRDLEDRLEKARARLDSLPRDAPPGAARSAAKSRPRVSDAPLGAAAAASKSPPAPDAALANAASERMSAAWTDFERRAERVAQALRQSAPIATPVAAAPPAPLIEEGPAPSAAKSDARSAAAGQAPTALVLERARVARRVGGGVATRRLPWLAGGALMFGGLLAWLVGSASPAVAPLHAQQFAAALGLPLVGELGAAPPAPVRPATGGAARLAGMLARCAEAVVWVVLAVFALLAVAESAIFWEFVRDPLNVLSSLLERCRDLAP